MLPMFLAVVDQTIVARNIGSMIEGNTVRNAGYFAAAGPVGLLLWSGPFDK